jgi:hypothetical protein
MINDEFSKWAYDQISKQWDSWIDSNNIKKDQNG